MAGFDDIEIMPGKLSQGSFQVTLYRKRIEMVSFFRKTLLEALCECSTWTRGFIRGVEE
jgi:hypothetical protein